MTELFNLLTAIPHCSGETSKLKEFLVDFVTRQGCRITTDKAGNIHAIKGSPSVCLQAHYDMVCLGDARPTSLIKEGGWLRAEGSTLGADNGMGVAMILALTESRDDIEVLLTNDEEIGLIGANRLAVALHSPYLLNLDSEELGSVYVGCAGGFDASGHFTPLLRPLAAGEKLYMITLEGLPGGHSGVDIDKGIPNAIIELARLIRRLGGVLAAFKGGERPNSIPKNAHAIVALPIDDPLRLEAQYVRCEPLGETAGQVMVHSGRIIDFLSDFPNGVIRRNDSLDVPEESLNLAMVDLHATGEMIVSGRAMSDEGLTVLAEAVEARMREAGMDVAVEGKYRPWPVEENPFIDLVCEAAATAVPAVARKAIHAGLECAVLKDKYPHIAMASIGPTIERPHSFEERVDLASVATCYRIVVDVLRRVGAQ